MALPDRLRLCAYWRVLCLRVPNERPLAPIGADLGKCILERLESLRPLRDTPSSSRAERVLRLQSAPATRVWRHGFRSLAIVDLDRIRYVSCDS